MAEYQVPEFPSLNGFNRKPMLAGLPMVPAIMTLVFFAGIGMVLLIAVGPKGLLFSGLCIPVLIFFKQISATDDDALRILGLEILCLTWRYLPSVFGKTLTLSPIKYGRHIHAYRRPFEKNARG